MTEAPEKDVRMVLLAPGYKDLDSVVPGHFLKTKADCKHDAWISPEMRGNLEEWRKHDTIDVQTICEDCALNNEAVSDAMMEDGVYLAQNNVDSMTDLGIDIVKEAKSRGTSVRVVTPDWDPNEEGVDLKDAS